MSNQQLRIKIKSKIIENYQETKALNLARQIRVNFTINNGRVTKDHAFDYSKESQAIKRVLISYPKI